MKRSDNITWSQLRVGIFIVMALTFLGLGILMMGKRTKFFEDTGSLSVLMPDVAGLKVGAPVWLAGIDVGAVTGIRFEKPRTNNDVEILLQIQEDALKKIGDDSVITVKTRGLLGEKYVDITPSSTYHDTPPKALRGVATAKLDDVMAKAGKTFDHLNVIVDKVNKGEGSLGKFANDPKLYDNLTMLTSELHEFADKANSGNGTVGKLVSSREPYDRLMSILERADRMMRGMEQADGSLNRFIHDRQFYDKLVGLADKSEKAAEEVRELNRKISSRDGTIGMLLTDRSAYDKGIAIMNRVDESLRSLEETMGRVNRGEGTAGKVLSDKELYDKINKVVDNVDALVKDVKENPKRYLKFSVF